MLQTAVRSTCLFAVSPREQLSGHLRVSGSFVASPCQRTRRGRCGRRRGRGARPRTGSSATSPGPPPRHVLLVRLQTMGRGMEPSAASPRPPPMISSTVVCRAAPRLIRSQAPATSRPVLGSIPERSPTSSLAPSSGRFSVGSFLRGQGRL